MVPKEYRSWSFGGRSFLFAAAVSVLWHMFWFFSITIDVNQHPPKLGKRTEIVSLGPVLDDAIFKALIDSRTEFSKTFYRQPEEFVKETEVPQAVPERYAPGDVVSMPAHKSFISTLKQRVGGDKGATAEAMSGVVAPNVEDFFEITGDVQRDQLLEGPGQAPLEARKPGLPVSEFQIFIDVSGKVSNVRVLKSTGDAEADNAWEQLLYEWVFRPSTLGAASEGILSAKVTFHPTPEGT